MKLLLECNSGISGNMFIGSLLDLGLSYETLQKEFDKLDLYNYHLENKRMMKNGISSTYFNVSLEGNYPDKKFHQQDLIDIVMNSNLTSFVKEHATNIIKSIFLVKAESFVFGTRGMIDTILDSAGSAICLEAFLLQEFFVGQVYLGTGTMATKHCGTFELPSKEVLSLLNNRGFEMDISNINCQLVTTTGAAILREFGKPIQGKYQELLVGYGAGSSTFDIPNVLRSSFIQEI